MDKNTLAELIYQRATHDVWNGVGRIIIGELNQDLKETGEKPLTAEEIIEAFQQTYPQYKIERRTENVILIHLVKVNRNKGECLDGET